MKEIIDYKVIKTEGHEGLERLVNDLIKEGWQPTGGMFVTMERIDELTYPYFYQSLVLYRD